jgi:hypothetical protein
VGLSYLCSPSQQSSTLLLVRITQALSESWHPTTSLSHSAPFHHTDSLPKPCPMQTKRQKTKRKNKKKKMFHVDF